MPKTRQIITTDAPAAPPAIATTEDLLPVTVGEGLSVGEELSVEEGLSVGDRAGVVEVVEGKEDETD